MGSELYEICKKRAEELGLWEEKYIQRLRYELGIISEKGFEDYFLILRDLVSYAKGRGILVGPGRGSAAGSLVSFLLEITMIDPLKYDLYFERFLNPARPDLPDIDVDFQASRRQEVFDYIKEKYGEDHTCKIVTYSRFHIKQVIRDLCRIFDIPMSKVNRLSKAIPPTIKTLKDAEVIPEVREFFRENPQIYQLAIQLHGAIRQKSVHAAGVVITPEPITEYMAREKVKGEMCSCFDMNTIDQLGLLKIDILALKTLDVIAKTLQLIPDSVALPLEFEDPEVYKVFQDGWTLGVFQFESSLLTGMSKKLRISDFKTLYAATTIARPGPLHSGEANRYICCSRGKKEPHYIHESIKPIVEETCGVILFQEQTMRIAVEFAGFSMVEAEKLRKIIGKSKGVEAIDKYKTKFIQGAKENKIKEEIAQEVWDIIRESGAYSFNKSHAVSYSAISYWCAWLKQYYPKEFLTALMVYEEDEMQDKAVRELRELGYEVLPPNINISKQSVSIGKDGKIYMGISDVEGIGQKATDEILLYQPYSSFDDFISKVQKRKVNSKVVKNLIQAGAFDEFGRRDQHYYTFSSEDYEEWDIKEMMKRQNMVLDMPAEKPLIEFYEDKFEQHINITPMKEIDFNEERKEVWVKGVISDYTLRDSNGPEVLPSANKMVFFKIDDGTRKTECFVSPEQQLLFGKMLGEAEPVIIKAHVFPGYDKLYVDGVINLAHEEWNVPVFMKYVEGREVKEGNVVISCSYHVSKSSNKPYARVALEGEPDDWLIFDLDNDPICAGEIVVWSYNKQPFMEVEKRIK
jgi:DNA polymerase-3 subunit alpha